MAQRIILILGGSDRALRRLALCLLAGYRRYLGGFFAGHCRFTPTCSEYAVVCFRHCNFPQALWRTVWRLLRCHPFCPGGDDPPPAAGKAGKGAL